ncbi:hypothetical protein AB0L85_00560 [Streptomyces sp. NPDC052051]|uniref:hypothetical protein n=1 Tax=Streptomyces sp. NPDC052051 TaxID=3154649 RepID=UPI003413CF55
MRTVYALFVGIDDYPDRPPSGCLNDAREAQEWLRRQRHVAADIRRLADGQAPRAAVVAGIERHLAKSGRLPSAGTRPRGRARRGTAPCTRSSRTVCAA